jgi:hypothetical protein
LATLPALGTLHLSDRFVRGLCLEGERRTKAIAMRYRGVEFSVVQGIERHLWKWTVSGTKISGQSRTRDDAIDKAKKAIARAIREQNVKQDTDGKDRNDF